MDNATKRPTLKLPKDPEPAPANLSALAALTPAQIAEILAFVSKQQSAQVVPPTLADAWPSTPIADTSRMPPVGSRASSAVQAPPRTWGDPSYLKS